jgi:putative hydrolase of the HAD superfamily
MPKTRAALIFDLDNTLYPASCRLFDQIEAKMTEYVARLLSLPLDEAYSVQKQYFEQHGTTLIGLMQHHQVEPHHFMDYVHDIDTSMIPENAALKAGLRAFSGRKVVFTNGSLKHAENILGAMGLLGEFDAIFDIHAAAYRPKPDILTYYNMLETCAIDPTQAVMFEDMPRNLEPAHQLGMETVLIESDTSYAELGDAHAAYIHHRTPCPGVWLNNYIPQVRTA